jgi:hypothetical protein
VAARVTGAALGAVERMRVGHNTQSADMRISMLVGNGLSIGFREHATAGLEPWHPSFPLAWSVPTPGKPSEPLIQNLPKFAAELATIRNVNPHATDFELFDHVYQNAAVAAGQHNRSGDHPRAVTNSSVVEARHYLANAYVQFQLAANRVGYRDWEWTDWLRRHASALHNAVSFNYDTVLEHALDAAGVKYHRYLAGERTRGVHVLKAHGSIDFAFRGIAAVDRDGGSPLPPEYPLQIYVEYPDIPREMVERIGLAEALRPRLVLPIVLPSETSAYRELQWMRPGLIAWKAIARKSTHIVIVGLSYWDCDRAEIDELMDAVPQTALAFVADPQPNPQLVGRLEQRFASVTVWSDGVPRDLG